MRNHRRPSFRIHSSSLTRIVISSLALSALLVGCASTGSVTSSSSSMLVAAWLFLASIIGTLVGCGGGSLAGGNGIPSVSPSPESTPPLTPTSPTPVPALPAAKLAFGIEPGSAAKNNNPAVQAARALPTFTVIVQDANGGTVKGATNAVTVALDPSTPGKVSLQGTLTVNAVDGVATFSDVRILPAGAGFVLVASASGLAPDNSLPFAINPLVNLLVSARRDVAEGTATTVNPWISEGVDTLARGQFTSSGHTDLVVTNSGADTVSVLLGNGDGTFVASANLSTGRHPTVTVAADFDKDGKTDIAVGNEWQNPAGIDIMLGNGDGTFKPKTSLPSWVIPTRLVAADLGDGNVSLVIANRLGGTDLAGDAVLVMHGNGDGTFAAPRPVLTGVTFSPRRDVAVGTFTQSGHPDIVVAQDNAVLLLKGNGDGTFAAPVNFSVPGIQPVSVAAAAPHPADSLSVLITDGASKNLVVLRGNGDGTFNAATNFPIPNNPGFTMAVGDIDGDGIQDVAIPSVPDGTQGVVSVLHGQADGQFNAAQNMTTSGPCAKSVVVGDMNDDGKLDLATLSGRIVPAATSHPAIGGVVSVHLNQGGGVFPDPTAIGGFTQTQSQVSVDLDGDGFPEIVTTDVTANDVKVLRGNADGTFAVTVVAQNLTGAPDGVKVGDFNDDGHPDLAIALSNSPAVAVLLGNGDGTFQAPVNVATASKADNLVVGDFNADGKNDIVTANQTGLTSSNQSYTLLLGNGDGTFQAATNFGLGKPWNLVAADFNGDGKLDIASVFMTGGYSNVSVDISGRTQFPASLSVMLGNGDGTFQAATNYNVASQPFALAAGDLDHDGKVDLVIPGAFSSQIDIMKGNGDGKFQAPNALVGAFGPNAIELVDVDFDGNLDIVTANRESSSVSIFYGKGDGTFPDTKSIGGTANFRSLSVGDFNRDGMPDVSAGGVTAVNVFLSE